eukprot:Em0020g584a
MTGLQNSGFLMWRSYAHHYFELMESVSGELARRFDQRGLNLATQFERIIIDSCNGTACEKPQEIMDLYARDLDIERLKQQLSMLPDLIKTTPLGGMLIKKVSTASGMHTHPSSGHLASFVECFLHCAEWAAAPEIVLESLNVAISHFNPYRQVNSVAEFGKGVPEVVMTGDHISTMPARGYMVTKRVKYRSSKPAAFDCLVTSLLNSLNLLEARVSQEQLLMPKRSVSITVMMANVEI